MITNSSFFWLLFVVLGFPLSMLLLGEIIPKLERQKENLLAPLKALRNLVLPTLVLYIVLSKVIGWGNERILVRLAETSMWISLIYTSLAFLNLFLFGRAKGGSWQSKVPKIFLDTSRFFLVLLGAAIVLSKVWGQDLAGLITALGVGSLVIGLALQDSLGNIFSGLVLLFERPFQLGDWIKVGETIGKVQQITWSSVYLSTKAGNVVIVPNSELAKGRITNLNLPIPIYELDIVLDYSCDDPPNKVKSVILEAALGLEGVLSTPPPDVVTCSYGDFSIKYLAVIYLPDFSYELTIKDRFLTRLWYVNKRANLTMPYPTSTKFEYQPTTITRQKQTEIARRALLAIPAISKMDEKLLDILSRQGVWLDYARDEVIISQGSVLKGMYLVIAGSAKLVVSAHNGHQQTLSKVSEGGFFGEKASLLTDQHSDVTIVALEDLTLLFLDKPTISLMLQDSLSSHLVNELGELMELRRRTIYDLN